MANEITYSSSLSFTKGSVSSNMSANNAVATMAGTNYVRESLAVTTTAVAIPLGSIGTPGWLIVKNNDVTNYVEVYTATAGVTFGKVLAGETWGPVRISVTAPALKANTATCQCDYLIIEL